MGKRGPKFNIEQAILSDKENKLFFFQSQKKVQIICQCTKEKMMIKSHTHTSHEHAKRYEFEMNVISQYETKSRHSPDNISTYSQIHLLKP